MDERLIAWVRSSHGRPGPGGTTVSGLHDAPESAGGIALDLAHRRRDFAPAVAAVEASGVLSRLEGIVQVFAGPGRHSNRASHSREVAAVAATMADALGCNADLATAIGLAHDCGHPPGGHIGENLARDRLDPGFSHGQAAATGVLAPLGMPPEVLDGVRSHTWSAPGCSSPEADLVRWADRIAYITTDLADALRLGVLALHDLPPVVRRSWGDDPAGWRSNLTEGVVEASRWSGVVCLDADSASALGTLRILAAERIYSHPAVTAPFQVFAVALEDFIQAQPPGRALKAMLVARDSDVCPAFAEPFFPVAEPQPRA